jgi:hypothetical protein
MKTLIVETKNGVRKWKLDSECREEIKPIADEFGVGIERFLFLYSLDRLPGQLQGDDFKLDEEIPPDGFAVKACKDPLIWNRVQRAARHDRASVKEFVWRAIASFVTCTEQDAILSPRIGELFGDYFNINKFCIRSFREDSKE